MIDHALLSTLLQAKWTRYVGGPTMCSTRTALALCISSMDSQLNNTHDIDSVMTFVEKQPENHICPTNWMFMLDLRARRLLFERENVAGAFGLDNALFTALLRRNESMLKRILPKLSNSPDSFVSNGISAAHIAVFWPEGLKTLTEAQSNIDMNGECCQHISIHLSPIELALGASQEICNARNTLRQDCPCAESVEILLNAGCQLVKSYWAGLNNQFPPSKRAIYVLLNHIKLWREKLKNIAERELTEEERHQLGIHSSIVLDNTAPKVIRKLQAKGICPSGEFQLDPHDYRLSPQPNKPGLDPIYHQMRLCLSAQVAFDLGFRDVDAFYERKTPIMIYTRYLQYGKWLLDHGASANNLVPWDDDPCLAQIELPRWTVAHRLMGDYSRLAVNSWRNIDDFAECAHVIGQLSEIQIGDGCECSCSDREDGCSPFSLFLGSAHTYQKTKQPKVEMICGVFDMLNKDDISSIAFFANAVIRAVTFEALGIRHTCCATMPYWMNPRDLMSYGEDFPNVRDEDEPLLEELEELVAEHKDRFHSRGQSLPDFLRGYWKERMDQINEEKKARRLTQEERRAVEELGVNLSVGSEDIRGRKKNGGILGQSDGRNLAIGSIEVPSYLLPSWQTTMRVLHL
ncbi:uncharacterized protein F4822DRAFT_108014 [Hypoxylon trugodes]|uniref:uncharacterized protein n=1 Tax=Hypoxylon trugodes TaxID=326681 RepID=UPI00219DD691|nr:uncharacterized protein F4822DRAFT_108014 [Hypoxylon trugodes]KAI1391872.1 hypothetical protein F4822DRAFT_108014 [Hypoxylon trugodes]